MTVTRKLEKSLFTQIVSGEKREIQLTGCKIHTKDTLILEEWDQETQEYTGRKVETVVTAVEKVAEIPAGSVQEATEHGSLTVTFNPKSSKYTPSLEHEQSH